MSSSFSLSLELIYLMNWLLKNEQKKLKEIIQSAISNGFAEEIEKIDLQDTNAENIDFIHNSILNFLIFLEDQLIDNLEKTELNNQDREKVNKIIQQVNRQKIDMRTIIISKNQAKKRFLESNLESNNKQQENEIQNILLSQILKNWKPNKNEPLS